MFSVHIKQVVIITQHSHRNKRNVAMQISSFSQTASDASFSLIVITYAEETDNFAVLD